MHGTSNVFVYLGICSLAGSLSVMSCKVSCGLTEPMLWLGGAVQALGIALKLTFQGDNQLVFVETHVCIAVVVCCVLTQMNYLNKALDLYNTAIVSPVYYVMFTVLTIVASVIMFNDIQSPVQLATEACGFLTIVGGTFLLHSTRDLDVSLADLG
ncbi:probable magnesium transporter, partial [Haematococcus lacustris]